MLVITRRIGERVYIGNDTYITLLDICGNKVRLGIVAPPDVVILREELLTPRQKDDIHAASTHPTTTNTDGAQDNNSHRRHRS